MRARCGRCGTGFEVMQPGRYACPACGVTNEVRGGAQPPGAAGMAHGTQGPGRAGMAPPPPPPERPSKRATCRSTDCGFSFIVGDVAVAPCPMCGAQVPTGRR